MCDLVSVVIPVYNVEDYLDECLESVVSQTYKKLEIVVVNDGSTDNSALKCREWQERDNRIRFYSKDNEGLGPARNFGIEKATGKWIAFLDADDWYDLQFVEKMLYAANQYDSDMVTCNISRYNMVTKETFCCALLICDRNSPYQAGKIRGRPWGSNKIFSALAGWIIT